VLVRGDVTGFNLQPACVFSNLVVQATQALAAQQSSPVPLEAQKVKTSTGVDLPAQNTVLLAPKHSPPCLA
jgi:hypothetical protein